MNTRKTTEHPTQTKESEAAKPSGLAGLAQQPSLAESWLSGLLENRGLGLRPFSVPMSGNLTYDTVYYAVHEARRTLKDQAEEYVRAVWDVLDSVFCMWFVEKGIPEDRGQRAAHFTKLRNDYFSGGHKDRKGIKFWTITTHYDLYCQLQKEEYPRLLDAFSNVSREYILAVLVLHDCANGLQSDIGGASHELTFLNGFNAKSSELEGIHARFLETASRLIKEKLGQQKKNLALGRPKGKESNEKRAADIKKLFLAVFTDHCKARPFSKVEEHVVYVHKWATGKNITVGGTRDTVIHDGNRHDVTLNGKKPYSLSYIRNLTKGVKAKLK